MEFDRTADVPIRHRFVDYVCSIGYSEYEGEFKFISARYAAPSRTETPPNGHDLFLRVLKEPALRATMLEALVPDSRDQILELREKALSERGKNVGFAIGLLAFSLTGYGLYKLTLLLARHVGYDWAELITYIPTFFAFVVIFPVQALVERWHARRYCLQHSHRLETFRNKDGSETTWCKRCGLRFDSSAQRQ